MSMRKGKVEKKGVEESGKKDLAVRGRLGE
jgi:hypothetical protein